MSTTPLTQAGSNRQYFRITCDDGHTVIAVRGTSLEENNAFIALARHFATKGLNTPRIIGVSPDGMEYTQEDLGSLSLFDAIAGGRSRGGDYSADEIALLERTISFLPRFQQLAADGLDFSVCYPQPEFDRRNIMFDLNYFKYSFLKSSGVDFHELRLEDDFEAFASDLLKNSGPWGFMIRDFQARNVMLRTNGDEGAPTPYYIDFQGGRRGPMLYDLASFLWQASARYPQDLREHLIDVYMQSGGSGTRDQLRRLVLFRTLQVLGAYGYRGWFERKPHFLASIPPALQNLRQIIDTATPYPHLHQVLTALTASNLGNTPGLDGPHLASAAAEREPASHASHASVPQSVREQPAACRSSLHVLVYSFSYKRGIPTDPSGNGGGYVFDCRSTHNPGRYEPYKQLTGLDQPVIDFLENDGEITVFLDSVYRLADAHVERYIERGFTHLMFAFGCTGGQHRSVYSAQHLAEHLHAKYSVPVTLVHREQDKVLRF